MSKNLKVYNLEFPPYINELKVGAYKFKRVDNYEQAFGGMMHLVNSTGSEFSTKVQTGGHQVTAKVKIPENENICVLPFGDKKKKQLEDVLFFLSLFTMRNVFVIYEEMKYNTALVSDHRLFNYGAQLSLSTFEDTVWRNEETGEIKTEKQMNGVPVFDWNPIDIGFEKTLGVVLKTIESEEWQAEYEGGYFLFLFKSAIQRQIHETSFLLCWTIWEHLFAIKNRAWLDSKTIESMPGEKKIGFILNKYFLKEINDNSRKNINRINKARNRLVHFGIKTTSVDYKEMDMFIRLTEQLMAIVLKLKPSNAFNSYESLEKFLSKK